MNGTREGLRAMLAELDNIKTENTVIICPPFTLLKLDIVTGVKIGAQDCSAHESGAFTGEISAKMIADTGAKYVIVGHSERRLYHAEANEIVREKAMRALEAGLTPIICVGETKEEFEAGRTLDVIEEQVKNSIISHFTLHTPHFILAYEPVWAIGTGLVPTTDDIARVHAHIAKLVPAPILYGGSVKGGNAAEIMGIQHVDGVLVGGASLKPDDFIPIIKAV